MITAASSATTAATIPSIASAASGAEMGRDDFLQLLVAQLQNQDPTSPQEGHEFAAQLAQFSSVEQLTNIGQTLAAQANMFAALAGGIEGVRAGQVEMADRLSGRIDLQAATSLIGQSVDVSDGTVEWDGSSEMPIAVRLGGDAQEVTLTIRDAEGAVVRTIRKGAHDAGDHSLSWDGALADGSEAKAGTYTVEVTAVGPNGAPVTASPVASGVVERLTVEGDGVFLWIGGRRVPFESLLSVGGSTES